MWTWFSAHKRTLPWRDLSDSDDRLRGYKILVSEVMLQQTQVSRVVRAYVEFLSIFPTVDHLASASNAEVIIAWSGMGYNSRALRLRDAARVISQSDGFPKTYESLITINGIGPYTAGAILNFAFRIPTPCIDTNIRKILWSAFYRKEPAPPKDKALLTLASEVLSAALETGASRGFDTADWHAALMDLGSIAFKKTTDRQSLTVMKQWFPVRNLTIVATVKKPEPGRRVGSSFIPRRIFRGRIVEALRKHPAGLSHASLGERIASDWQPDRHAEWLTALCDTLIQEGIVDRSGSVYRLRS